MSTIGNKPCSVIRFNKTNGKLEEPTLLLKTRGGKVLGNIKYTNLQFSFVGKGLDTMSFDVHKVTDGKECEFWDKLIDLSVVDYKGYGQFEAHVTLNDENESIKSVTCESLETELGQHIIHEMHINDDDAITNLNQDTTFVPTTLCDFEHPEYSLLHRVLAEKAPHWRIAGCSPKINIDGTVYEANSVQREFTINGQTPYNFFDSEVSREFGVIFTYDTYKREVYCHNLEECVYDKNTRKAIDGYHYINGIFYDENEQIVADTSNLAYCEGIGSDTNIFVSKSKLANSLSMESEQGSVKNCFYVSGGDDIITNTIGSANLTGNEIFIFGNFQTDDMSEELNAALEIYRNRLNDAQEEFTKIGGVYIWDPTCKYDKETGTCKDSNGRVLTDAMYATDHDGTGKVYVIEPLAYYNEEYNTCCDKYGAPLVSGQYFYNELHKPGLYTEYCHLVDRIQYLEHEMTPIDDDTNTTTASDEKKKIIDYFNKNYNKVIITNSCSSEAFSHVTNNIESMIQVICSLKYSVKILSGESYPQTCYTINEETPDGIWSGYVRLERETDSSDFVEFELSVNVRYVKIASHKDEENLAYCKQKMEIAIAKMDIAELDFTKLDDDKLRLLLEKYNLASLKEFYTGFESCITILKNVYSNAELNESDITIQESDSHIIASKRYNARRDIAKAVYDKRLAEVAALKQQKDELEKAIDRERENLNLETFLEKKYGKESGMELWKEFYSYIREDEYNNPNYISDGLSDTQCLTKAKELLDAAKNELSKACMIQYTVSGDINNIFSQKQLECLHEKFDLFNYIRAEIDNKIYKLRLTEIRFSYDSPEKLEVTFSQQIESVDHKTSDTQKILEQAASIATSYSSTIRQAAQGSNAFNTFNQIRQEGLDSSMFLLKNSKSEEQTFGNAGLYCREMTDTGIYSDNQLAVTHNGIYMTDNGFKDINTAFGKFKFDDQWVYGINADVVLGNLIVGKDLKITDGDKGNVEITGDGVKITGGSLTSPNIESGHIKGGTITGGCIEGGYLSINKTDSNDNTYYVEIDPNNNSNNSYNNYMFNIRKEYHDELGELKNELIMGVNSEGKGFFSGDIDSDNISSGDFDFTNYGEGMLLNKYGLFFSSNKKPTETYGRIPENGYTNDLCYVGHYRLDLPTDIGERWEGMVLTPEYIGFAHTTDSNMPNSNNIEPYSTTSIASDTIQTETLYSESQVNTSDKRLKTDIQPIHKPVEFIQSLQPREFQMASGKSGRKHFGFLAQDVEESLSSTTGDAGVLVKYANNPHLSDDKNNVIDFSDDTTFTYGLRYDEFIAPMVATIQDLYKQVDALKEEINELKTKIKED